MSIDMNPYRALSSEISPDEFECFCMETLKAYAKKDNLKEFTILHNESVGTHDGVYQIDILGEFNAMGIKFKIIVECKMYTRPVEREKVCVLYEKQQSLGANKSVLMSTSGFQSGAVQYAKAHGITLIQIVDSLVKHIQNSSKEPNHDFVRTRNLMRKQLPNYFAMQWDCDADYPYDEIYPTKEMYRKASEAVKEQLKCLNSHPQ